MARMQTWMTILLALVMLTSGGCASRRVYLPDPGQNAPEPGVVGSAARDAIQNASDRYRFGSADH